MDHEGRCVAIFGELPTRAGLPDRFAPRGSSLAGAGSDDLRASSRARRWLALIQRRLLGWFLDDRLRFPRRDDSTGICWVIPLRLVRIRMRQQHARTNAQIKDAIQPRP